MKGFFYSLGQLLINFPPWPVSLRTDKPSLFSFPNCGYTTSPLCNPTKNLFFSEYTLLSSAQILFPRSLPLNGLFHFLSSSKETLSVHCIMWKFTFKNSSWGHAMFLFMTSSKSPRLHSNNQNPDWICSSVLIWVSSLTIFLLWHHTGPTALLMVIMFFAN